MVEWWNGGMVERTRLFRTQGGEWPVNKVEMDHLSATTEVKKSKSELPKIVY